MNQLPSSYTKSYRKPGHGWLQSPPPAFPTASLEKQSMCKGSRTQSSLQEGVYNRAKVTWRKNYCIVCRVRFRLFPPDRLRDTCSLAARFRPGFNPHSHLPTLGQALPLKASHFHLLSEAISYNSSWWVLFWAFERAVPRRPSTTQWGLQQHRPQPVMKPSSMHGL